MIGQNNEVEVQVLFTQQLDSPDEDEAIASDKFLVQLTPAPTGISASSIDGRELMQQLIQAWTTVDRKEKYEFRLRVAKRKEVTAAKGAQGPGGATAHSQGGVSEGPNAGGSASANEAQL